LGWALIGEEGREAAHLYYVTAVCDELAAQRRAIGLSGPVVSMPPLHSDPDALASLLTTPAEPIDSTTAGTPRPNSAHSAGPATVASFMKGRR
jgi:hypothetical protein